MSTVQFMFPKEPMLGAASLVPRFSRRMPIMDATWRVEMGHSARYALFRILSSLPHDTEDEVLVPAFSCIALAEAVLAAGYKVRFYDTKQLTSTSTDDLRGMFCARTRALVVIHFFGYEQDTSALAALCRGRNMLLIEDFAHSLPLFDFLKHRSSLQNCDVAIFSMKKMLPLTDGGFAIYRASLAVTAPELSSPPAIDILRPLYRALEGSLRARTKQPPYSQRARSELASELETFGHPPSPLEVTDVTPTKYAFEPKRAMWSTSSLALRMWGNFDLDKIAATRRRNSSLIRQCLSGLPGISFPLGADGDDKCLWGLPFLLETVQDCDYKLRREGVPVFTFARPLHPLVGSHDFPTAKFWSENLKLLPVHQDLTTADVSRLRPAFETVLS